MSARLAHQLADDGLTIVYRPEAAPPLTLRISEDEGRRFAWSLLADLDPDSTLGEDGAEVVAYGPLVLDCATVTARFNDKPLHLTNAEWMVARVLASRSGRLCTRQAVMAALYGSDTQRDPKIVDTHVCRIRAKLRAVGGDGYLESEWGKGYRLVEMLFQNAVPSCERARANNFAIAQAVLQRLAEKPAAFPELCALNPHWNRGSLRGAINRMMAAGLVVNVGHHRAALYALKDADIDPRALEARHG